ncbi:hypothetical protein FNF27_08301 [Cafeteria roenbergensis]|uniref:Uncharacterized protein n=1 Tax=Cafeteria roenbergensis TaxID=33653 RepID=A0A5A8D6M8_CAFRO|nr:hypothetical protein FNF27_08301 [Cafeteria roenbergensis]
MARCAPPSSLRSTPTAHPPSSQSCTCGSSAGRLLLRRQALASAGIEGQDLASAVREAAAEAESGAVESCGFPADVVMDSLRRFSACREVVVAAQRVARLCDASTPAPKADSEDLQNAGVVERAAGSAAGALFDAARAANEDDMKAHVISQTCGTEEAFRAAVEELEGAGRATNSSS